MTWTWTRRRAAARGQPRGPSACASTLARRASFWANRRPHEAPCGYSRAAVLLWQLQTKRGFKGRDSRKSEIARIHAHTHTHASKQAGLPASPHVKASALEAHARLAPKRSTGRAHTSTAPGTHSSPSDPRPWIRAGVPRRPLVGHARGQPAKTALLGGERVGGPRFLPPRVGGPRFLPPQLLGGAVGGGRRRALVALVMVRVGVRVGVGVGVRVRLGFG